MCKCRILFTTTAVLLALLLFPGCTNLFSENTTHIVENAKLSAAELESGYRKITSHIDVAYFMKSWDELAEHYEKDDSHYLAFCGHKKSSVSYWEEDGAVAYTRTEMEIDTVLACNGGIFDGYAEHGTITLIEQYAVDPKGKIAFSTLGFEGAEFTLGLCNLTDSCRIIDNENQYIIFVSDQLLHGDSVRPIVCKNTEKRVIEIEDMNSTFVAQLARRVDTVYMEAAGQDEKMADIEKRNPNNVEQKWDCIYYDLMKMLEEKNKRLRHKKAVAR